ncbi:MAG: STT3 domain-containing protein [Candidatus Altiarchaeota archaeon]
MVSKKKSARKSSSTKEKSITLSVDSYERITSKFREPVFLVSLLVLVLTAVRITGTFFETAPWMLSALFVASLFFTIRDSSRPSWAYVIPLLVFISALFSWYVGWYDYPANKDYLFFSFITAIILFFTTLTIRRIMDWELAAVLALFLSATVLHVVPATSELLGNLDSYWQYKWMRGVYSGHITEYDDLVYPMIGGLQKRDDPAYIASKGGVTHGLPQHSTPMLNPTLYGVMALVMKPFGFSLYDIAMLLPGVLGGLAVIPMYLLVKEMFSDMRPHNRLAALTAAFIFMLSPGFAINGTAANCEDDVFGMFLMLSSFYLFFASVHRRSFKYAVLAGLSFMMLKLTWAYTYAYLTVGAFGIIYALILFMHRENCTKVVPYLFIAVAISQLSILFTHEQLTFPVLEMLGMLKMPPIALIPIAGAIGLPIILEAVRVRMHGKKEMPSKSIEDRVDSLIQDRILVLSVIVIIGGVLLAYHEGGPIEVVGNIYTTIMGAKLKSVVHQTVSEQNPMAGGFVDFLNSGYGKYGIALLYGLFMLVPLAYLALGRRSIGALFLLTWSIPMMWGSWNKSAWIFAASPSVTVLGASIGLYAAVNKKELDDWRIIGTLMLLVVPVLYVPFFGDWNYNSFVGHIVMHMGFTLDIYYWQPMLDWAYNETSESEAILTWWDYGHWITAVSQRPVLIDNLQADYFEIQDVARFFVNKSGEQEAFKMVEEYNDAYRETGRELKYVAIDWTMIGKGSALHFIANGDIESNTAADPMWAWRNYGQCRFLPENSILRPQIVGDGKGGVYQQQRLLFGCSNYIAALIFNIRDGELDSVEVITPYGDVIPWSNWAESSKASILGVQPLGDILMCASSYASPNVDERTRYYCRFYPTFNTLVYVPDEFNDFMLTNLYLTHYVREYKAHGLYTRDIKPLRHFRPIKEFSAGYVRVYEISYDGFNDEPAVLESTDAGESPVFLPLADA